MPETTRRADVPRTRARVKGRDQAQASDPGSPDSELQRAIRRARRGMDLARSQGDSRREMIHLCELDTLRAKLAKLDPKGQKSISLVPSAAPSGATCTYVQPAPKAPASPPAPEGPPKVTMKRKDPRGLAAHASRHRRLKEADQGSRTKDGGER